MSAWAGAWGAAFGDAWGSVGGSPEPDEPMMGGPDARARTDFDDDEAFQLAIALITSGILECA